MSRVLRAVERWWFGEVASAPMVAARILLGSALFLAYVLRVPHMDALYGDGAAAWFAPWRTFVSGLDTFPLTAWVTPLADVAPDTRRVVVWCAYALMLLASLCFTVGFWTRRAGIVALLLHSLFLELQPYSFWGWAMMIRPFLAYTLCAPAGRWCSLDARGRTVPPATMSAWPLRLLQIHVCAMYAEAGLGRLDDPGWLQGNMLYAALVNTEFTRFAWNWDPWKPVLKALTLGVFLLEPLAPVALWVPRVGRWCALALIAMHVGLELLTRVGFWNFVMVAGLCAFLPKDLGRWLRLPPTPPLDTMQR